MKSPTMRIGVAATAILVLFAWSVFDADPAWAQVVKAFNQAPDVHVIRMDTVEPGIAVNSYEAWIKDQNRFRVETDEYSIIDDGRRVLTLYKGLKVAHVRDSFSPFWDYTPVILKVFQKGQSGDSVSVTEVPGERTDTADVYSVDFRGHWTGTAWVDRLTNLPLRVAGSYSRYVGQAGSFETRFDYEPIADTLFATAVPADYREIPNVMDDGRSEDALIAVAGTMVDPQGTGVPGARVFASYAAPGQTDSQGTFALAAPPADGSRTIGESDLPMFIWAYADADLHSVAWTVIRRPTSSDADDAGRHTERTHHGVTLTVENEDDFRANLPGHPGYIAGADMETNPQIANVVLVAEPAGVITGRVTDANGVPIARTLILVEELELRIGSSSLSVSNLEEEWKAGFLAATDDAGRYTIGHLPISWTQASLVVRAPGHGLVTRSVSSAGQNTPFDIAIGENGEDPAADGGGTVAGYPVRGGADVVSQVVPESLCGDLMLYYSFHTVTETGIVPDISGGNRPGHSKGADRVEDPSLGGVMSFGGRNDYVDVPDVTLHQFTFCAWVNSRADPGDLNNRPVFRLAAGNRFYSLQGNTPDGIGICTGVDKEINEYDWSLAKGAWTHISVTCDGQQFGIYRNGVLTEEGQLACEPVTGTLHIGAARDRTKPDWFGLIDEVALFDRALTPEEVRAVFEMTGVAASSP